jgi:hypothetical protein
VELLPSVFSIGKRTILAGELGHQNKIVINLLYRFVVGKAVEEFQCASRVSTLSGVVMAAGISVVIFIFGGVCAFMAQVDVIAARLHSIVRTNAIFMGPSWIRRARVADGWREIQNKVSQMVSQPTLRRRLLIQVLRGKMAFSTDLSCFPPYRQFGVQ